MDPVVVESVSDLRAHIDSTLYGLGNLTDMQGQIENPFCDSLMAVSAQTTIL